MKKVFIITLITIAVIIAVAIIAIVFLFVWAGKQPMVKDGYYNDVKTSAPLEQKFTLKGDYEVSYYEQDANNEQCKKYEIWYPTEMETSNSTYPLVVMVNGTGVTASKYKPVFDHLASWGFIVIGNEDESAGDGASAAASLDYILTLNSDSNSKFYGKINVDNIGIGGHSQGGLGAINAVTAQDNGNRYKAMYAASAPTLQISVDLLKAPFDISGVNIPCFMVAGTKKVDAGDGKNSGICPLVELQEKYNNISDSVSKIIARRVDTDHGDMLPYADGYMTAWFMYWLKADNEAGNVFFGEEAEILSNSNWQDVQKNN
ncbi:MAG: alpha/beta hydrolase [Eubacteriales bacterium]|nr:alpha/beta hydrolase [Eubacteriales bacterium]